MLNTYEKTGQHQEREDLNASPAYWRGLAHSTSLLRHELGMGMGFCRRDTMH
jgi:hypothetical protein